MNLKTPLRPLWAIVLVLFTFGIACKKENLSQQKESKEFSSKSELKAYLNERLQSYAKIVAKLATKENVRKLVKARVAEKFDGDYNVLLKDLVATPKPQMLLKKSLKMSNSEPGEPDPGDPGEPVDPIDLDELAEELSEPVVINGTTVYPQIFIPFYEDLNGLDVAEYDPCLGSASPVNMVPYASPVIVAYDGDESAPLQAVTGIAYDMNGDLVDGIIVDECYASKREVWVISVNEHPPVVSQAPATQTPPPAPVPTDQVAFISNMRIKADKESWLKGANDVYITYTTSWDNGVNPVTNQFGYKTFELSYIRSYDSYGLPIKEWVYEIALGRFTNNDIRKNYIKAINANYAVIGYPQTFVPEKWTWNDMRDNYPSKGTHLYYVIYEYDTWANHDIDVPLLTTSGSQGHTTIPVGVSTNNSPYITGAIKIVPNNYSGLVDISNTKVLIKENDEIKFNGSLNP